MTVVGRRHARGEREAVRGALERGEALPRAPSRVGFCVARVVVALVLAERLLGVGGGLVDRHADRAGRRVRLLPGVDGAGLEVQGGSIVATPIRAARRARAPSNAVRSAAESRTPACRMERQRTKRAGRAVGLQVGAADEAVAAAGTGARSSRRCALVRRLVDLDHVAEAEEPLGNEAIPDQVVERGEQDGRRVAAGLGARDHVEGAPAVLDLVPDELALLRRAPRGAGRSRCVPPVNAPVLDDRGVGEARRGRATARTASERR